MGLLREWLLVGVPRLSVWAVAEALLWMNLRAGLLVLGVMLRRLPVEVQGPPLRVRE